MTSANSIEPAHYSKFDIVRAIEGCYSNFTAHSKYVVKPARGSYQGYGVDFESPYTVEDCESQTGLPCGRQPYHPGPWEARMYKSKTWHETVAWNVPSTNPHAFTTTFPWEHHLKSCIDKILPNSPCLAVDVRTDGENVLVLEVNGAFGLPLSEDGTPELDKWFASRLYSGLQTLCTRPRRILGWGRDFRNAFDRLASKSPSKVWF